MSTPTAEGNSAMGLLPPFENKDPEINRSVYLPSSMWDDLSRIAEETKAEDPKGKGYSRNEVIKHALRKFIDDWDRERASSKKKR